MQKTLTTKMVENVQAQDGVRVEYRNSILPSFGLRRLKMLPVGLHKWTATFSAAT